MSNLSWSEAIDEASISVHSEFIVTHRHMICPVASRLSISLQRGARVHAIVFWRQFVMLTFSVSWPLLPCLSSCRNPGRDCFGHSLNLQRNFCCSSVCCCFVSVLCCDLKRCHLQNKNAEEGVGGRTQHLLRCMGYNFKLLFHACRQVLFH